MRSPYSAVAILAALASLLGQACADGPAPDQTGVARLAVRALGDASPVARVTVRVSGTGPAFEPITADLSRTGGQWLGRVERIPAGPSRQFEVVASSADGAELMRGAGQSAIRAGGSAVVAITISGPGLPGNGFPQIDLVAWSQDPVAPGDVVQLVATAADPDGDALAFRWSSDCAPAPPGAFDDPSRSDPRWTAPPREATCHLQLAVTDTRGASVRFSFTLAVANGAASVSAEPNAYPIIVGLTGVGRLGARLEGEVQVEALDPEGDLLAYRWRSSCPGIALDSAGPAGPAVCAYALPPPAASCPITVEVGDGHPAGTTATLLLPAIAPGGLPSGGT